METNVETEGGRSHMGRSQMGQRDEETVGMERQRDGDTQEWDWKDGDLMWRVKGFKDLDGGK